MFRARQQRCHSNGPKVAADDSTLDYPSKTLIHSFPFSTEKFPAFSFWGRIFSIFSFVRINRSGCNCSTFRLEPSTSSYRRHRRHLFSTTFITNVLPATQLEPASRFPIVAAAEQRQMNEPFISNDELN